MRRFPLLVAAIFPATLGAQARATVPGRPTVAQFLSPASPLTLVSAAKADRIAWMAYDRGMRNVDTAAAPSFAPVRVTSFLEDDGTDLTDVQISADGATIVFVRGSAPNRFGWVANPTQDPNGAERAIWAVRASGGPAWRVAEGSSPELSPDGKWVLFTRDGQIFRARVARGAPMTAMDTGGVPFIREWGRNGNPSWSPDGSKIAFVSDRVNHAFVAVYDVATRTVRYLAPAVDCDGGPTWAPDSRHLAFYRRPGVPFGNQAQAGQGGIGNPAGPAAAANAAPNAALLANGNANPSGGCGGGFGARGAPQSRPDSARMNAPGSMRRSPGFYSSTLKGGYTLALMIADAATGNASEVWHNARSDSVFTSLANMQWANDHIVFPVNVPGDDWDRWYSIMQFYHWAYAYNQWLASQGYIVLSINYRSGVGYGKAFREAAKTQARGNSEYQDVLASAHYLQHRADVDSTRMGIWGLSYGGLLTSQALARNSDIFVAGADLAGVHLYGNQVDSTNLAFRSSAVGAIDGWKSPVFLVHGDDDRNVDFAQTVGLVQLLRARNVYYELTVIPDDLHESMVHSNWVDTFGRMGEFFKRFVWNRERAPMGEQ